MTKFLLDTNVISELSKPAPNPACQTWLSENETHCHLSAVTIAELKYGVERLPAGKRRREREQQFEFLLEDFQGRFFEFDGFAAVEWGRYAAQLEKDFGADWWKQFDQRDTEIAAIAREYGLTVVTRNQKHFPLCETFNPFGS